MSLSFDQNKISVANINYFSFPKKIIFGVESLGNVKAEINRFKAKKILLVTDEVLKKVGLVRKVTENLQQGDLEIAVYDKIQGEPNVESVMLAAKYAREGKYDVLIGLGGGSVLDTTKLVAALSTNPGDISNYMGGYEDKFKKKPLPKILIPTNSGTGSENTQTAVIKYKGIKDFVMGQSLYADIAVVDPSLTLTCPPRQTAASGMDALSHAIDGILSNQINPLCLSLAKEVISLISTNLSNAYHNGADLMARWNMSMASSMGGLVMNTATSEWPVHVIAQDLLGAKYNIPHGTACSMVLPYVMEFNIPAITEILFQIAVAFGVDKNSTSRRDGANKAVEAITKLIDDLELPCSLKELNISRKELAEDAEQILKRRGGFGPRKFDVNNLKSLLEKLWEGKID